MTTAFQRNAFQNNAFQIDDGTLPSVGGTRSSHGFSRKKWKEILKEIRQERAAIALLERKQEKLKTAKVTARRVERAETLRLETEAHEETLRFMLAEKMRLEDEDEEESIMLLFN